MGLAPSTSRQKLATLFRLEGEGRRGPVLGATMMRGAEARGWQLAVVTPLQLQVFDACTAQANVAEDHAVTSAVQAHAPFTAFCWGESGATNAGDTGTADSDAPRIAVGCQDGTVLVFDLSNGCVSGPIHELRPTEPEDPAEAAVASGDVSLARSITVVRLVNETHELYAGCPGRCFAWDLRAGDRGSREFRLTGSAKQQPADTPTPSALAIVHSTRENRQVSHLWVGLGNGYITVFDVETGALVRNFSCTGAGDATQQGLAVVSLVHFPADGFVFALSAHRRVSVWEESSYEFLQKYPADLITCGSDLSAMTVVTLQDPDAALLVLAGVDGSLCVRKVSRRADRKINCVLLSYMEAMSGDVGCPITSLDYHAATDSVLVGDAGCSVTVLAKLREQLGAMVQSASAPQGEGGAA